MRLLTQLKKILKEDNKAELSEFINMLLETDINKKDDYCGSSVMKLCSLYGNDRGPGCILVFKLGYLQAQQDMGKQINELDDKILNRKERLLIRLYRQLSDDNKNILISDANTLKRAEDLKENAKNVKIKREV